MNNLRTEGFVNPLGIDRIPPRFSWIMESSEYGDRQTAYQILAASDPGLLTDKNADLWNSGKVNSPGTYLVAYEGKELASGQEVFWKVRIWDAGDRASGWSETASFSVGLLEPGAWKAQWIGLDRGVGTDRPDIENRVLSARYLRKEFSLEKPARKATATIVGMGTYEMQINGKKVGDHVLSPDLSEYAKRSYYVTYDVTANLKEGANALGVILGNGRYFSPRIKEPTLTRTYGFPKLLLQLDIEFKDGSREQVISDPSWRLTAGGPIRENNEYDGEVYDARMELPGWSSPGYDDSSWMQAERVDPASPEVSAQKSEPIRITESITPVSVSEPEPGVYIYDMGQNMVGWTRLSVSAPEGTVIKQRFAETLKDDGTLYLANIRGARVTDTYIAKGEGTEVWEPRFVFHGFRYVELTGLKEKPALSAIEGKVIHDDLESTGSFHCSDPLINQIYRNAIWGLRGNYRSVPTDCPQRDERQGWLGDRAAGSRGESYAFDIRNLYRKWLTDVFDSQKESGSTSDVSPAYWPLYLDNVTWSGTPIQLVKMLYDQYGDEDIIRESYRHLVDWVLYMEHQYMERHLMPRDNYGDWCVPPIDPKLIHTKDPARLTDGTYLGTTYFYHNLELMEVYAKLLGYTEDAVWFRQVADDMKVAFNREFYDPETGQYSNNTATANVLALAFGLVPSEREGQIFDNLVEKIEVEHDSHMTTGLIGQQFINRVLTRYGRADLAYAMNTQTDYPGYGYMIENGATTIWELWNGNTADPAMNSGNHVMLLGDFLTWLYEDLAGIKPAADGPGFRKIVMKPHPMEGLDHVKASHRSPMGWIRSEWKTSGSGFEWEIDIPSGSMALMKIPASGEVRINRAGNGEAVSGGEMKDGRYEIELGSGSYQITSELQP